MKMSKRIAICYNDNQIFVIVNEKEIHNENEMKKRSETQF